MPELMKIELPDGQVIWAQIQENTGPRDVGLRDQVHKLRGLTETIQGVAHNVREGLEKIKPDEVTVGFGVELALGKDGLVAALAGVNGKAMLNVTLAWHGTDKKRPE